MLTSDSFDLGQKIHLILYVDRPSYLSICVASFCKVHESSLWFPILVAGKPGRYFRGESCDRFWGIAFYQRELFQDFIHSNLRKNAT